MITHTPFPTTPRLSLLALLICATFPAMAANDDYLATINAEASKLTSSTLALHQSKKTRANSQKPQGATKNRSIASKSIASQPAFEHYLAKHLRASYRYYQQLKKTDQQRVFNTAVASRSIPSVRRRIIDFYLGTER